jgi:hypothetical protein
MMNIRKKEGIIVRSEMMDIDEVYFIKNVTMKVI